MSARTERRPRWLDRVPARPRYDSGIPVDTDADAVVTAIVPLVALVSAGICLATVRPLGLSGWGLVGLVLIIVNTVVAVWRSLPDAIVTDRTRWLLNLVGAPLAGLIWGFDPFSWAESFGFMYTVHVGIRYEPRLAASLAVAASGTGAAVLAARQGHGGVPPWWVAALMLVGVVFGMLRRSRRSQLAAAHELVQESRRAAAGEARAELARDLHDVLAHSLSGVNMQLSLADALFEADRPGEGRDALRRAQTMVVAGLGEARRAVSVLRAGTLDVVATVAAMVTGEHERFVTTGAPTSLGDVAAHTVVRVAQEALTNARRHAPGAAVLVTLAFATDGVDAVRLEVVNDAARGASPQSRAGSGLGLVGMRERAAAAGAQVAAGPVTEGAHRGGWRVLLTLGDAQARP